MQLEQPALLICAAGFAEREVRLGMFIYGGGLGFEREWKLDVSLN